jgi:hypothetical protein
VNTSLNSAPIEASPEPNLTRVSHVLRSILSENEGVESFSVERILASIGEAGFDASLMMFSIPAIVPVPCAVGMTTLTTGVIACQMVAGHKQIHLPRFIRRKTISRRALAVAIHSVLPVLEAAEKVVKPRWRWVNHSIWRRAIGLFVLLLVIAIAFPLFGFNALHASSIFVISLGMAEKDGLAVMVGVVAGVLSLAIIASGVSVKALRSQVAQWVWKLSRKLGLAAFATVLETRGHTIIAKILRFEWSSLLLRWNPEKRAARPAPAKVATHSARPDIGPQQAGAMPDSPSQREAKRFRLARSWSAATASFSSATA